MSSEHKQTECILGIDAGLTKTKSVLFTPDGEELAVADRKTPVTHPAPNQHEVELETLWDVTTTTIREVIEDGPVHSDNITGIGVAGHGHGLYALDTERNPVRPGIKSTDSRATDLMDQWETDGTAETIDRRLGYRPFAADPLSLLAWLKKHEPQSYERIHHLLFCKDYLKYRLTETICTDEMEASVFYDPQSESYDQGVFEALGLEECIEALPAVVPSWESCGEVSSQATRETGLPEGIPVASGLHDIGATALGVGAHRARQCVLILGTWGQSIVIREEPTTSEDCSSGLDRRFLEDHWISYKGNRSATACLDWFLDEAGHEWRERASAEGVNLYELSNQIVTETPPGAEGLLFYPYLEGSTDNPSDRGGFYGLTTDHTKAHMLRSIYEGVALAQSLNLVNLIGPTGIDEIRLGGGGARSEIWSGIFANCLDENVLIPAGEEAGARGAAISAAIAVGTHSDHTTAVEHMVDLARRHEPDPELVSLYEQHKPIFEDSIRSLRQIWQQLS
ncbi:MULTISPECIES: FGGY-family carbohydrate kinase [Natrialbaceae]|uniref:FGGY-family carbohydrate kinase n=1 Tax=Natrialbaceae TaxID=1644061 RepID=UPI00207D5A29|nr:FGGY-family carbohydrate kinase [Natronococcus sp. CG52]